MHKGLARTLALLLSTGIGLGVAAFLLRGRFEAPSILRVDEGPDDLSDIVLSPEGAPRGGSEELYQLELTPELVTRVYRQTFDGERLLVFDPDTYFWERPNQTLRRRFEEHPRKKWAYRTNDWGCRQSKDVRAERPDLRFLVTGDSHTAGVVPYHENFVHLAEASLKKSAPELVVEGLNAGKGNFDFYNYVGVLEKFASLEVDVFVLAVFAGNDFMTSVRPYRLFNGLRRLPAPSKEEWGRVLRVDELKKGLIPQDVNQYLVFRRSPEDVEHAATLARQALVTMSRVGAEREIELLVVLIPPCSLTQPDLLQPELDEALRLLELEPADLAVTDRLSDRLLADAAELGIPSIDMRPHFRASEEPCYWRSDLHINTLGHALVAREIASALQPRLER